MEELIIAIIIFIITMIISFIMSKKMKKSIIVLWGGILYLSLLLIYLVIRMSINPIIVLKGNELVNINVFEKYEDAGYIVKHPNKKLDKLVRIDNNVDTDKIGVYDVVYSLKYNNKKIVKRRKVKVIDNVSPIIELKGNDTLDLGQSKDYVEPGYTATDNYDGDITDKVKVTNNINSDIGKYELIYTVEDSSGNSTQIKRIINKFKDNNGVIYLTFDDGPSSNTTKILEILKKENIKATFFIVNYGTGYDSTVKRIVDEGHTLALHSYTHQYKLIYSSEDAYYDDLYKLRERVKSTTGIESNIIRFPGGSSNTISSFNKGIMTKLVRSVKEKGFHYFDWNVDSRDAGGAKNKEEVYNNVIKGLVANRSNVVLMHDLGGNKKTVDALPDIIKTAKGKGYSFNKITYDTPMVTHNVNN